MRIRTHMLAPVALLALALGAPAQDVGSQVGQLEISEMAATDASSFEDFVGRAVLLEFFAYW